MPSREAIVEAARKYLGLPFRHQGRGPSGLDCAGLLVVVGRDLGLTIVDDTSYRRIPDTAKLRGILNENLRHKPKNQRRPGDVLLFKDPVRRGHAYHLGIQTDVGFIHAYGKFGIRRVVEMPWSEDWERAIVGVFEYPGLED